jgi:homoserine kinase type II
MPFFIELLDVLHEADMPVPYALRDRDGNGLRELCGKPALLQPRLSGKHIKAPNNQHCAQVGELLAHIHLATREHIIERRTDRGLDWMLASGAELLPGLTPSKPRCCNRRWTKSPRTRRRSSPCPRPTCTPTCSATT